MLKERFMVENKKLSDPLSHHPKMATIDTMLCILTDFFVQMHVYVCEIFVNIKHIHIEFYMYFSLNLSHIFSYSSRFENMINNMLSHHVTYHNHFPCMNRLFQNTIVVNPDISPSFTVTLDYP